MKFPRIHPVRRARRAYRNAADRPAIEVTARGDFIQMRIDQLRQFRKRRGAVNTAEAVPKRPPYANGAPAGERIPRTTNADIKAIVRAWDQVFQTHGPRSQRLGGKHNKAFEAAHRQRWEHTKQLVAQHTRGRPGAGEFTHNPEFWTIWLYDVAAYLSHRQQGRPSRMEIIADVLEESLAELPDTLATAAHTAATKAARKAGQGLTTAGSWLKWGALAAAGLLIVPPILRARKRSDP